VASFPAPSSVPVGVDPTRASIARVYDAALGGKDNYEIDRQVLQQVSQAAPEVNDLAKANRGFLTRACRFLADQGGITQFLDCGSGLPTAENTHQIVQRVDPSNRVVYIDNDPVVIAHGEALLAENEQTHFGSADIFKPEAVLTNPVVRKHIDFDQPLALLHVGTLHHYPNDDVAELMHEYYRALPRGSFVAIAHFFDPENEHSTLARQMEELFLHSPMGSGRFRTRAEIMKILDGLDIIQPAATMSPGELALCDHWWPDGPKLRELNQVEHCIIAAVGQKP
jgi:hypothetical protein